MSSFIDYGLNNYMCTQGHNNMTQLVVQRFFNCVAKVPINQLRTTANPEWTGIKEKKNRQTLQQKQGLTPLLMAVSFFGCIYYLCHCHTFACGAGKIGAAVSALTVWATGHMGAAVSAPDNKLKLSLNKNEWQSHQYYKFIDINENKIVKNQV